MTDRKNDMEAIFDKLSEKDKDIMILIAKGMKMAQDSTKQLYFQAKATD